VQTQSNTRTISGEEAIGFLGKPYFKNLPEILAEEQPDILVIGWPYALDLIFNSTLRNTIKKYKIKLIYKGIPFNLPAKNKIKSFYYSEQFTGGEADAAGKNFLGFLKFYLITQLRGFYLRMVDAHVYYIDEAIENIASYGVAKEKIFITYNSPDTDTHLAIEAQLHEQKAEHSNLLHVGRLVKWKRVDLLIDAYRKLKIKYPQLTLTIVGNGPEEANLKNYADKNRVNPDRIIFAKRTNLSEHLARHKHADLFLDTFPYNAHTTASDSLWAGLPVLTCKGNSFASRVAASLLNSCGLSDFITSTFDEYESKAIELSNNPELILKAKNHLNLNKLITPLFDAKLYVKNIETAYSLIYENYLNGISPNHIFVD
jgi:glycosyltransferase involved in cell wall biosynthesis